MTLFFRYQIKKKKYAIWPKQSSNNYHKVPIINLSSVQSVDISPLEHILKQCLVDKNKHIKKDTAVEFETLCCYNDKDILSDDKENFHEHNISYKHIDSEHILD